MFYSSENPEMYLSQKCITKY